MAPENRDEVRRRIDSLYERAENATGNFNATRAMAAATRRRGASPAERPDRRPDPAVDAVARQWFDAARARLGPTVPAALPADRLPDRTLPARSRDDTGGGPPGRDHDGPDALRPALDPGPAGRPTGRELPGPTGGSLNPPRPAPESGPSARPAGRSGELPTTVWTFAAGDSSGPGVWGTAETAPSPLALPSAPPPAAPIALPGAAPTGLPAALPAASPVTARSTVPATAVPAAAPSAAPGTALLGTALLGTALPGAAPPSGVLPGSTAGSALPFPAGRKAHSRRKLTAARDLLSRYADAFAGPAPAPVAVPAPAAGTPTAPAGTDAPTGPAPLRPPMATAPPEPAHAPRAARAVAFARAQIGRPCVWGATGPDSFDCSGLVQAAWRAAGVGLPRAAHEQALAGTPVALAAAAPGDLVFFFADDRHVGLCTGDGMMVHAPGPGSSIREESVLGAGESAIHRVIRPA